MVSSHHTRIDRLHLNQIKKKKKEKKKNPIIAGTRKISVSPTFAKKFRV
jgi:hypothetical protein